MTSLSNCFCALHWIRKMTVLHPKAAFINLTRPHDWNNGTQKGRRVTKTDALMLYVHHVTAISIYLGAITAFVHQNMTEKLLTLNLIKRVLVKSALCFQSCGDLDQSSVWGFLGEELASGLESISIQHISLVAFTPSSPSRLVGRPRARETIDFTHKAQTHKCPAEMRWGVFRPCTLTSLESWCLWEIQNTTPLELKIFFVV